MYGGLEEIDRAERLKIVDGNRRCKYDEEQMTQMFQGEIRSPEDPSKKGEEEMEAIPSLAVKHVL